MKGNIVIIILSLISLTLQSQTMKVYHTWMEVFEDKGIELPDSIVTLRQVDVAAYHFDFEKANSKQWKSARKNAVAIKRDSSLWVMSDYLFKKCGAKQFNEGGNCLLMNITPKLVYFIDWDKRVTDARKRRWAVGLGAGLGGIIGAVAMTALETKPNIKNQECCFSMIDPANQKVIVINPKNFKKLCKSYSDLLAEYEALDKDSQESELDDFFLRYVDRVNEDNTVRPFVEFYKMRAVAEKSSHQVRILKDDTDDDGNE